MRYLIHAPPFERLAEDERIGGEGMATRLKRWRREYKSEGLARGTREGEKGKASEYMSGVYLVRSIVSKR